ncbi:MAG: SGNH/GDSL hydrolase family protein [Planctomycetes bacterium]|nr:SGNH/GDSL hydrolase family protein [Planctomycetota bacterium]
MKYVPWILVLLLGAPTLTRAADPGPKLGTLPAGRVLFLGNSITLHGPAPAIGWTGNWGMAASAMDKDYVHIVTAEIAKSTGVKPETRVRNIADFERGYEAFDITSQFKAEFDFKADLIIIAIGENVAEPTTETARASYQAALGRLISTFQQHGHPTVFARSSFWPNASKDEILHKASADAGATFIDLSKLGHDASNAASAERKIEHAGVAAHPGDKGMRAIADEIIGAIKRQAGLVNEEKDGRQPVKP